jgi:hypothetical protein
MTKTCAVFGAATNGGGTDNGTTVDMWDYVDGAPNEIFDIYP